MNGIFNVDKPTGMSSHAVVAVIRRASGLTRVGHAGTLDPMATGVLLICVGQGTRVSEYLMDHDKKYRARVRLGIETDTYDATGAVIAERPVTVTYGQVASALSGLVGKIEQMPPAYSAIKRQGVPLYKLARRGLDVQTAPRSVEIYSIAISEFVPPDVVLDIHCSKGTYIRSLAHDLGKKLETCAHLAALSRTASGQFSIDDAVPLDQLRDAFAHGEAVHYLHPLDAALSRFPAVTVDDETAKRIRQGNPIPCGPTPPVPLLRAHSRDGSLVALLEPGDTPGMCKPRKVFT